jgi:hypothetical protein
MSVTSTCTAFSLSVNAVFSEVSVMDVASAMVVVLVFDPVSAALVWGCD